MTATAFVEGLQSRGALLEVDGARLRVTPSAVLTDADRSAWREHKAAILELLESGSQGHAAPDAPPALQKMPGMELHDDGPLLGLWLWRGWCVPTAATMPDFRRYHQQRSAAASGAATTTEVR